MYRPHGGFPYLNISQTPSFINLETIPKKNIKFKEIWDLKKKFNTSSLPFCLLAAKETGLQDLSFCFDFIKYVHNRAPHPKALSRAYGNGDVLCGLLRCMAMRKFNPALSFWQRRDASILSESLTSLAAPLPRIMLIEVSKLQFTI